MLGDKIGSEQGKVTSRRILPGDDYRYVKMEISFEAQGNYFGTDITDMGTYTVFERVPGQMYGEGQGIIMAADGASAIWNGHGVGHPTADGGMAFAASVAYQAGPGKLERLNGCLVVIEHSIDAAGDVKGSGFEWKA